jgi:diguanylate cyclase (GGDEF)-like protein
VVKVKIYDLDGLTVFSTDPVQIGQDKSGNPGFLSARKGTPIGNITFRDRFNAFEGVIVDRDLAETYVPIRVSEDAPVEAVFEIYSDVTDLVNDLQAQQWEIGFWVIGSLSILYALLFVIMRQADKTIQKHKKEQLDHKAKIHYQAHYDSLTGLHNRTSFGERLEEAIKRAHRAGCRLGLLQLDLDHFKLVNDSLGQSAGDQVLRTSAKRMQACIRESDMLFRTGSDQFAVIMQPLRHTEDASRLASRIIEAMTQLLTINGQNLVVTASIGISIFPEDDVDSEMLVKSSDAAMHLAKQDGRNQYRYFSLEMKQQALERLEFESGLKTALQNEEFVLYYQPRVATHSEEIVAVEALIRWANPERGLVPPNSFIPLLEETGLIHPVGEWVLHNACQQTKQWHDAGMSRIRVSVNISSAQFKTGSFVELIKDALAQSALDAEYLELELTESVLVENIDNTIEIMNELKEIGVSISIDDFGSGYSSLNYVRLLPLDFLKIDRSFVKDLATSDKDVAIIKTIAALAQSLNIKLVAEGVEEDLQMEFLRSQNCNEFQGFLFSPPVPSAAIPDMISKQVVRQAV